MNLESVLEGLLFVVGDDGLSLTQIANIMDISEEEAKRTIDKLDSSYDYSRGMKLELLGNNYKLTTKKEHAEYYKKLMEEDDSILSQSSLETLAIIAYNEPITRVQIDEIRGVNSSYIVRKLLTKNLIKDIGRSDLPGKPILYVTTNQFLDYFGLSSKEDLPKLLEQEHIDTEIDLFESKYKENIVE